jgi:hypothetical protein
MSNDYFIKLLINESEELEFNLDNNNSNGNRVVVVRNGSENELLSGGQYFFIFLSFQQKLFTNFLFNKFL